MKKEEIIKIIENYVKISGTSESAAHDWWHIYRVYNTSKKINKTEKADDFIISMIALLHDVFDWKNNSGEELDEGKEVEKLLNQLNIIEHLSKEELENITHSISNLGFRGGLNKVKLSKEGQIVQDADRLEATGAIMIARTFSYGGKHNRPIYNPDMGIIEVTSKEEYKKMDRHSINHFYEKAFKLPELMNTEIAKKIAIKRNEFIKLYLEHFFNEWDAKDLD